MALQLCVSVYLQLLIDYPVAILEAFRYHNHVVHGGQHANLVAEQGAPQALACIRYVFCAIPSSLGSVSTCTFAFPRSLIT